MAISSPSILKLMPLRRFSTSSWLAHSTFKFKLTDEMMKEHEAKQSSKLKEEKPQALHTQSSSLIMGKVSSERFQNVVKVGVPKHRLNETFLLYVRENDDVYALDDKHDCKPGDWVLLRRKDDIPDAKVCHQIEKIVYSYGNFVDPLTGRRSLGYYYDDDMEKLEQIRVD